MSGINGSVQEVHIMYTGGDEKAVMEEVYMNLCFKGLIVAGQLRQVDLAERIEQEAANEL
jgi:hypothetical protein